MTATENIYFPNTEFIIAGPKANVKQMKFFEDFNFKQTDGYRYFFYGGAIRGGKSYVVLFILHLLCLKYPGSKWVVVRNTLPNLKKTTIPSFLKMLGKFKSFHGRMTYGAPHIYKYNNSSEIQFIPESITTDKDLTAFLGLECNGMFLEQIEELSQKMFDMAKQRSGSLYVVPMPPGFIFSTFNPTRRWIKKEVYEKHIAGTLEKPYYYMSATPLDNPHVTQDQWNAWGEMDSRSYAQMIEGDWAITAIVDNQFYYAFSEEKHVSKEPLKYDPNYPLWQIHDFNVDPIVAIIAQVDPYKRWVRILKEYVHPNSSTYDVAERIMFDYNMAMKFVDGDRTGHGRKTSSRGLKSDYDIIREVERLNPSQIKVPKAPNPPVRITRSIGNKVFEKIDILIDASCVVTINDLVVSQADAEGNLVKKGINSEGRHAIDCVRYLLYSQYGAKNTII